QKTVEPELPSLSARRLITRSHDRQRFSDWGAMRYSKFRWMESSVPTCGNVIAHSLPHGARVSGNSFSLVLLDRHPQEASMPWIPCHRSLESIVHGFTSTPLMVRDSPSAAVFEEDSKDLISPTR